MALFEQSEIQQVLDATDIVEVVSRYLPSLKKAGTNHKASCPFHDEKTASFMVSREKQIFKCFGCGAGGSAIKFVEMMEHVKFPEAVTILAESAGIKLKPRKSGTAQPTDVPREEYWRANETAMKFFRWNFMETPGASIAREYVKRRGLAPESVKAFNLGYSPDAWDGLLVHMKKAGYSEPFLIRAGLVLKSERGGVYDRFRGRLMFPVQDQLGRVIGFGARSLKEADDGAKYINSPDTPVFNKSRVLYGLNQSMAALKEAPEIVLVEGYLDVILAHQAGLKRTVAAMGTAFGDTHAQNLKRFAGSVTLMFDTDAAGLAAIERALEVLFEHDLKSRVAVLSEEAGKMDPADYVVRFGAEEFLARTRAAISSDKFLIGKVLSRHDVRSFDGQAAACEELLKFAAKLRKNPVKESYFIREVSQATGASENDLRNRLDGRTERVSARPDRLTARRPAGTKKLDKTERAVAGAIKCILLEPAMFSALGTEWDEAAYSVREPLGSAMKILSLAIERGTVREASEKNIALFEALCRAEGLELPDEFFEQDSAPDGELRRLFVNDALEIFRAEIRNRLKTRKREIVGLLKNDPGNKELRSEYEKLQNEIYRQKTVG